MTLTLRAESLLQTHRCGARLLDPAPSPKRRIRSDLRSLLATLPSNPHADSDWHRWRTHKGLAARVSADTQSALPQPTSPNPAPPSVPDHAHLDLCVLGCKEFLDLVFARFREGVCLHNLHGLGRARRNRRRRRLLAHAREKDAEEQAEEEATNGNAGDCPSFHPNRRQGVRQGRGGIRIKHGWFLVITGIIVGRARG